jgi:hypothetical protein
LGQIAGVCDVMRDEDVILIVLNAWFIWEFCAKCVNLRDTSKLLINWHPNCCKKRTESVLVIKPRLKKCCCWNSKVFWRKRTLTKVNILDI